jgi:quercetin dioxygenase-like cupin family protein
MRSIIVILVLGLCSAGTLLAQSAPHHTVPRAQLHWTATAIPSLEMSVVEGNPATTGPFVLRFRALRQVRIPAHWHPSDEHLTVLTGTASLGMGDRFTASALRPLHSGDYASLPKQSPHFAQFAAGTEVQLHGEGPFITNWVDPNAIKQLKPNDVDSNSERTKMKADQDKR